MLSSLASYLLGGNISGAQDAREGSNNETPESLPVMARFSQVEVEGDDWILIDRAEGCSKSDVQSDMFEPAVEGATALEESWYVMPPACFTRAGPVTVETSPLEDLLIEHPSMSVYRATSSPVAPDTPPPTPDTTEDEDVDTDDVDYDDLPPRMYAGTSATSPQRSPTRTQDNQAVLRSAIQVERRQRVRVEKSVLLLRSSQKVLERRTTQALKRDQLDRSNKLREVFSMKCKRLRRQDRMRIQNSGANNNRKC
ncbi:tumor protein p53 inducible nuclear protein isoform X1 [Megalopta genalis]|uniref:tumor protein p53 inducible nuclear protein isoform X1 n=1 Tax=Megalopta genalis TaxID=115081 RepID=UPI001443405A|nr:tumor protein p53-inducible nuclear protein 2 isoform X1 [Megalopta genalis]XP_033327566.1 tumor protein p53-inducible nuclear protein 2 isoform X1 [Megalopta genalis]XP_033327567.1 tumor protein p53-inducible nuclear protein 2 isoform X1 [Megalopta genalis]XP_033327568.1 tumor protein p53-inducible nuclear protein 2 isoform X1 [Megalopta genalis]